LEKSNEKFNEYKSFLIGKDLSKADQDFINTIQKLNLDKESIYKIAKELIILYNLEENFYRNKIISSLISLSYKDKIQTIIRALINLIDETKVIKGHLYDVLKIILSYIEKEDIPKTVNMSIKILEAYSINILDENNSFIKLYSNSGNFPEIIQNYLLNNSDDKINGNSERISRFLKSFDNLGELSKIKDVDLIKIIIGETNKRRLSLVLKNIKENI